MSDKRVLKYLNLCYDVGKPISLVRIGDGELVVLNGLKDNGPLIKHYDKQFGYQLSFADSYIARETLIEAINKADILGIPYGKEERGGYWVNWDKTLNDTCPGWQKKIHCSPNINTEMLTSGYLNSLLRNVNSLVYISCRNLDEVLTEKYNLQDIHSYIIAPEHRFTSGYDGKKHYPEQFYEIKNWILSNNFHGKICLVGAGFVGKIYCNWFRDRGGLALDIGSVFDLWAGRLTRGQRRGLDVLDNSYKL